MSTVSVAVKKSETVYTAGEIVALVADNLTVLRQANGAVLVRSQDGFCFNIPVDRAKLEVVRRVPVEGEPQPGDVWAGPDGAVYFAYQQHSRELRLETAAGVGHDWQPLHAGAAGPLTLVYRPAGGDR